MQRPLRVLIAEDNPLDAELLVDALTRAGFDSEWQCVDSEYAFTQNLLGNWDIILSDYQMPQFSGLRALELLRATGRDIPFIVISGTIGEDEAVTVMKRGASDLLLKGQLDRLGSSINQALNQCKRRNESISAEKALRDNEDKFRQLAQSQSAILNALPAHIALLNPSGFIVSVNDAWKKFGTANRLKGTDFLVGENYLTVCEKARGKCAEEAAAAAEGVRKVICGDLKQFALEYPCHSLVEKRWFRLMVTPLNDHSHGAVVMHVNVTEQRLAQQALRDSEARFRQLAENIQEVFWILNTENSRIVYVSPAYEKIWGRTCESLYNAPLQWLEAIHPDDRDSVCQSSKRNRRGLSEFNETYRIVLPNGSIKWIHDRAFPIRNEKGDVYRIVGTASDITTQRDLESQFRQAQKMEAFGLLAGGVAHDFNNLMSVVIGYSDLWLMKLPCDNPICGPLKGIRNAGTRACELTKQLLAFSRQTILEPKVVDLNTVLREIEKMLQRLIGENIQITAILDPLIPRIKIDPGQIGQVIMNLSVNSRDAMPEGGVLTLQTGETEFDETYAKQHPGAQVGKQVMLSVSDTGSGMPDDVVARIFEPFFTTKEMGKGTGLGLAVVYGIVTQSGGTIEVSSKVGCGTKFIIFFPATLDVVNTAGQSGELRAELGFETILVVEDEDFLRQIIDEILRSHGYRVLLARSGNEALKLLHDSHEAVHLVLTDVVMPGMSGRELGDTMSAEMPAVKFMFMSGYTDDSAVRRGLNCERVPFLQKPFRPFELLKKVREVLDAHTLE